MNEEESLKVTKDIQNLIDNMITDIFAIKSNHIDFPKLKSFAGLLISLIDSLGKQGYVYYILALDYISIEKLSPRLGTHRFSAKQMSEQTVEDFKYFHDLDNSFKELSKIDPSSFSDQIAKIQNLLDVTLPLPNIEKDTTIIKRQYQIRHYFTDYLTCIVDFYESFLLLCLYILILFKLRSKEDVTENLRDLNKSKKLSVYELYFTKTAQKGYKKLLSVYLAEFPFPEDNKQSLIALFENIFGDEGIRGLRNNKIHHFGEEKMRFVDNDYLEVKYTTETIHRYSLEDIYAKKLNIQLLVYLGFLILESSFFNMFHQLLEQEISKKKK